MRSHTLVGSMSETVAIERHLSTVGLYEVEYESEYGRLSSSCGSEDCRLSARTVVVREMTQHLFVALGIAECHIVHAYAEQYVFTYLIICGCMHFLLVLHLLESVDTGCAVYD